MIEFLRVEQRAGNPVAVFDRGYRQWEPTEAGGSRYDDGTFCLNVQSLRIRIANIEAGLAHPSRDASVEYAALAELLRATSTKEQ